MSFSILLKTIDDFNLIRKEYENGLETEENFNLAKRNLAEALNTYIDFRIDGVMENRKRRISISTISDILANSTDEDVSLLKTRLLLAPQPLELMGASDDQGLVTWMDNYREFEKWMLDYKDWFESVKIEEE